MGTGLGPTLEFYELVSQALRETNVWRETDDHSLFPSNVENPDGELSLVFKFMGMFSAKAICDNRLTSLPFSQLFWDLVKGKRFEFDDLGKLNQNWHKSVSDLRAILKRKEVILSGELENETK